MTSQLLPEELVQPEVQITCSCKPGVAIRVTCSPSLYSAAQWVGAASEQLVISPDSGAGDTSALTEPRPLGTTERALGAAASNVTFTVVSEPSATSTSQLLPEELVQPEVQEAFLWVPGVAFRVTVSPAL